MKKITPFTMHDALAQRHMTFFSPKDVSLLFTLPPTATKYYLETYTKQGVFTRLKKGLYTLKQHAPTDEEIANALYKPSYISFEYALARYHLIPEIVYGVTSATTKSTRIFTVHDIAFSYYTIKTQAFTGYALEIQNDRRVLIAEPEKAVVDYLYFVSLGKKPYNDRLRITHLNKQKLLRYARLYHRKSLLTLLSAYAHL